MLRVGFSQVVLVDARLEIGGGAELQPRTQDQRSLLLQKEADRHKTASSRRSRFSIDRAIPQYPHEAMSLAPASDCLIRRQEST